MLDHEDELTLKKGLLRSGACSEFCFSLICEYIKRFNVKGPLHLLGRTVVNQINTITKARMSHGSSRTGSVSKCSQSRCSKFHTEYLIYDLQGLIVLFNHFT